MTSPCCHVKGTVVDSRDVPYGNLRRRRRKCQKCGGRYNTLEGTVQTLKDTMRVAEVMEARGKGRPPMDADRPWED